MDDTTGSPPEDPDLAASLAAARSLWFSPSVDHRVREMFYGHSLRVMVLARLLAQRCGIPTGPLELAAVAHDLGMTGIYSGILLKPDTLDVLERGFIRAHVHSGAWICRELMDEPEAADIVLRHHERWDGDGYPGGLAADEIPAGARLLSVPDVFDTLAFEQRPYQDRVYTVEGALGELQGCADGQFDPEMVDELALLLAEVPDLRDPERLEAAGRTRMEAAVETAGDDVPRPGSDPDAAPEPRSAGGGTA